MRLIEDEELERLLTYHVKENTPEYYAEDDWNEGWDAAVKWITEETREVTRCADCIHCYIKDMTIGTCDNRWGMNGTVRPDDYCSRGRKRDTDQSREAR